jgi:plastocyanin
MTPGAMSFAPQKIEINLGDTITWKNNDTHNVVSATIPAGAAAFTSPILTGAKTFSQTPTKLGTYKYYCTLHASLADANATPQKNMSGEFTVVASGAAASPAGSTPAGSTPAGSTPAGQVSSVPVGGVQTGGGSTAGFTHLGLIALGGGLLIASFMSLTVSRRRFARAE